MINKIKILVVSHKKYDFPRNCYYPIHVGYLINHSNFSQLNDALGKNISLKNASFCELTALYWAWKNNFLDIDYFGLVHYRRYFSGKEIKFKRKKIASENEFSSILEKYDCILAKKRNYYIETVYSHYKNSHFISDLDKARDIIKDIYPDYLHSFDQIMKGRKLHLYNMFIMDSKRTKEYCTWLFDILFRLEMKLDISQYDTYQKRVFGFIAERLLNVWVLKNKLKIKELQVINIENENILKKMIHFLYRKFIKKGF